MFPPTRQRSPQPASRMTITVNDAVRQQLDIINRRLLRSQLTERQYNRLMKRRAVLRAMLAEVQL